MKTHTNFRTCAYRNIKNRFTGRVSYMKVYICKNWIIDFSVACDFGTAAEESARAFSQFGKVLRGIPPSVFDFETDD